MHSYQEDSEYPPNKTDKHECLLSMVHVLYMMEMNLNSSKLLDLSKLVSLDLSYNLLVVFPTQLSICPFLQYLNISHNNLTSQPSSSFLVCGKLTKLDLSYNNLSYLPSSLVKLPMLSHLSVSHNKLCSLPDDLASSSTIRELLLDNNKLTNLPNWISRMSRCSTLKLAHNPLGDLLDLQPDIGQKCRRLKYLDLSNISMNNIQSSLCKLLDLRHLIISNVKNTSLDMPCLNRLSTLPTELHLLKGLVKFIAVSVYLEELPDSIHLLRNLEILDVSKNNIRWLPSSFHLLPKLRFLNISDNIIYMLPLDFEKLPCLNHLLASNNNISELPEKLGLNKKLVTLDMYNNKLCQVQVQDILIKTEIVRCDFALNYVSMENLEEEIALMYLNKMRMLRSWVEDLGENYQISIEVRDERQNRQKKEFNIDAVVTSTTTEPLSSTIYSSSDDSDPAGDETEESSTEYNRMVLDDAIEIQSDDSDDWDCEGNSFDLPGKFQFRHNLERMDLEQYWGRDQFCPADQHCTRVNEIILYGGKDTNRPRQVKVGRDAVHRGDHDVSNTLASLQDQFEDADAEDVSKNATKTIEDMYSDL